MDFGKGGLCTPDERDAVGYGGVISTGKDQLKMEFMISMRTPQGVLCPEPFPTFSKQCRALQAP